MSHFIQFVFCIGGNIILEHESTQFTWNYEQLECNKLNFLAFYIGTRHEITNITSGFRGFVLIKLMIPHKFKLPPRKEKKRRRRCWKVVKQKRPLIRPLSGSKLAKVGKTVKIPKNKQLFNHKNHFIHASTGDVATSSQEECILS